MNQELNIVIEQEPPPAPKRIPPPPPPTTAYPFNLIPVGGAARFPRSKFTVRNKMLEYVHRPENKGQKFIIRALTPSSCRVWRVK